MPLVPNVDLPTNVPTLLQKRYQLISRIGAGGMGTVYRAVDCETHDWVAVKLLRQEFAEVPELVGRFLREAEAMSVLQHPSLVTLYAQGQEQGVLFLVMELLEGVSLACFTETRLAMPPAFACWVLSSLLSALEAVHAQGMIHRDIKSANLFITRPNTDKREAVKLLDFGFAKTLHTRTENALSRPGIALGTPAYFSPEQAMGQLVDQRSDLYSVGVLAFELFTGRRPFLSDSTEGYLFQHVYEPPPLLQSVFPHCSSLLAAVIDKALSKPPSDRFQSATTFLFALQQCPEWQSFVKSMPALHLSLSG